MHTHLLTTGVTSKEMASCSRGQKRPGSRNLVSYNGGFLFNGVLMCFNHTCEACARDFLKNFLTSEFSCNNNDNNNNNNNEYL